MASRSLLFVLLILKWICPTERIFFFISVFRNAFVIIILTLASFLFCRHRKSKSGKYPIKVLGNVPRGFQHLGPPHIDPELVTALASQLPVATIILVLEHIAISRCTCLSPFELTALSRNALTLQPSAV